jgi:hypothetical protein
MSNILDFLQGASNSAASNVSAPVDGIAWLLRKAGIPMPQAPFMGSDWMAQKGLTKKPTNALAGMAGETFGMTAPIFAAAKAPQIANALLRADEAIQPTVANALNQYMVKTGMIQPATVWHGSPRKFPPTTKNPLGEFDASKIGTGEGAQAYGHGHYTAEAQAVGQGYREALSSVDPTTAHYLRMWHGDRGKALQAFNRDVRTGAYGNDFSPEMADIMRAKIKGEAGYLYKVDLPDSAIAKMLDWDKPLSQQAPEVRAGLIEAMKKRGLPLDDAGVPLWVQRDPTGEAMHAALNPATETTNAKAQAAAANFMRDQGIPGIRYLDAGSRAAGQGTSNYVVFPGNEDLLTILERNGVPIK